MKREALEAYRYLHANMRMRYRYALEMSIEEYRELNTKFKDKEIHSARMNASTGDVEAWVQFKDTWVCASYSMREQLIKTFFPPPPPQYQTDPGTIKRMAQDRAAEMMRQAMKEGRAPRWFPCPENDLRWVMKWTHQALNLIERGQVEEGIRILANLERLPTDYRPSERPAQADEFIRNAG